MAQKQKGVPAGFETREGEQFDARMARWREAYDALYRISVALTGDAIIGGLIRFEVADNYAYYLVTREKPLKLQLIPYGYEVADAHIRGLRRADVLGLVKFWKRYKK
jgi:hypothetical protein